MNITPFLIGFACAGFITGCAASIPAPAELNNARQAYARVSVSPAAQLAPESLYKAREALVRAEQSFRDNPKSDRTRTLSILAHREAKIVGELATSASDTAIIAKADKVFPSTTAGIVKQR